MVSDNIFRECYTEIVDTHMNIEESVEDGLIYTDTTVIGNKYGSENIARNKDPIKGGKNVSKLSLVTDSIGAPLDIKLYSGNVYDSKIACDHINESKDSDPLVKNKHKIKCMVADAGYDSEKLKEFKLLKVRNKVEYIIVKNKRNTKDEGKEKEKLEKSKMKRKDRVTYFTDVRLE